MGYLQDVDRWLDTLLDDCSTEKIGVPELKRAIREKILESYKNGLKAQGQSPAPRESRDGSRRFPPRSK
jgi:hypothetical protein